jgi:hypothetical protein
MRSCAVLLSVAMPLAAVTTEWAGAQVAQPAGSRSSRSGQAAVSAPSAATPGGVPHIEAARDAAAVSPVPEPLTTRIAPAALRVPGFLERPVVASSASKSREVAAAILSRPCGKRVLLLSNLADDIAKYDFILASGLRSSARFASPWIDRGVDVVGRRVSKLAQELSDLGARPDVVIVRTTADLGADRFSAAWQAISADPRSATLSAALGVRSVSAMVMSQKGMKERWNQIAVTRLARYLSVAVENPMRRAFPGVLVALQDRSSLSGVQPIANSFRFGSHDLVSIRAAGCQLDAIREAVSGFKSSFAGRRRPVIAWVDVQFSGTSPEPAHSVATELACHAVLTGAAGAVISEALAPQIPLPISDDFLGIASGGGAVVGKTLESSASASPTVLASAAKALNSSTPTFVRITSDQNAAGIRLVDSLGVEHFAEISAPSRGAWVSVSHPATVASVVEHPTTPCTTVRNWNVIRDDFPSDAQPSASIGGERYMLVGQYDCDMSIGSTGIIHPDRVIAQVERLIAAGRGSKWGVLDFEEPFDALWEAGESDPRYRPAIESMVATIRALKARYPSIRWTYFGIPRVKYWFPDGEWPLVPPEVRAARYQQATAPVAALLPELDFVMPAIYDVYERAIGMPTTRSPRLDAETWWRRASVEAVHHFFASRGISRPPIVPMVSPWFQGGGFATVLSPIPAGEFLEEQLRPLVEAGVDGIGVWGGMRYALYVSRWPGGHPNPDFLRLRDEVRSALARDYLGGADRAPLVDWTSPDLQQSLATQIDATMSRAITACFEAAR